MIALENLLAFLEDTFHVSTCTDNSYNGLQFEGRGKIKNLVTGVDASTVFLKRAISSKADIAIVHHGLFWKGQEWKRIDQFSREKVALLTRGKLNLYALHLPLDSHPELGNNIRIAMAIGARPDEGFYEYQGQKIGMIAHLEKALTPEVFRKKIETSIGPVLKHLNFGPATIKKIGIVSGGGWGSITDPVVASGKVDAILTGEVLHQAVDSCRDRGVHMFSAGHYATEVFGVKALGELIASKFGIRHTFLDFPTGL